MSRIVKMIKVLLVMMTLTQTFSASSAWHLEARPSLKYTSSGGSPTITCYNISSTTMAPPYNPQWYKIASNGTLQQISTDSSERVRSDGSQLRISSTESKDNGTYCCKGPQQTLDTCDESATANLIVVVPPLIASGQNQTVLAKRNATIGCLIENAGQPPFTVFRWQKSGQRLMTDGTKYISELIGNRMFLTIINSTSDDEGYYQCILETPAFQRRQASVYLTVNHTRTTHTGLTNDSLSNDTYTLQLHGQDEISIGMELSIQCVVMESGNPVEADDIQSYLVIPNGEVIMAREFNTVATLEHNGTYSCIALVDGTPMMASLPVVVYAAPQPSFYKGTVSVSYGSNVTLPCTIDVANPAPSYYWESVSVEDPISEIYKILGDGSLQLKYVKESGIYQCTAQNSYGSSIQIIELKVEMTTARNQSLELVGKHLKSPCDQPEHVKRLSTLLQEYITSFCSCGDITVIVIVTSCNDKEAVYSIHIIGIMAADAAVSLITNMEGLKEGLDIGIAVLYLQEKTNRLESNCDDQMTSTQSEIFAAVAIILIIIAMMILTLLLILIYPIIRRILLNGPSKHDSMKSCYCCTTSSHYDQLQQVKRSYA